MVIKTETKKDEEGHISDDWDQDDMDLAFKNSR